MLSTRHTTLSPMRSPSRIESRPARPLETKCFGRCWGDGTAIIGVHFLAGKELAEVRSRRLLHSTTRLAPVRLWRGCAGRGIDGADLDLGHGFDVFDQIRVFQAEISGRQPDP